MVALSKVVEILASTGGYLDTVTRLIPQLAPIFDSLKERRFSVGLHKLRETIVSNITTSDLMSPRLLPYFSEIKTDGYPFVDFHDEPAQVSQLKKIINA